LGIDRPATDKTKEALINWVSNFLWYFDDAYMGHSKAAEIIVNLIIKVYYDSQGDSKNALYQPPNPQSFFECQE